MQQAVSFLQQRLAALHPSTRHGGDRFRLGAAAVDAALGGGLARGSLHEIFSAAVADAAAAAGFTAALALRAAAGGRSVVWVRQDFSRGETGGLHGLGLAGLGFDPGTLVLVQVHDALGVLRAGLEAARCPALGAAVIEPWGKPRLLDFTATRRLKLAAAKSGVPCLLLRLDAQPEPSAASTRWRVAASFSEPLAAGAPGPAAFDITLLRHRTGMAGQAWRLEWNHEYRVFREAPPLPGAVAALPAGWPAQPAISSLARSA